MAESKKTTRGSNFVKNFGRAKPALARLMDWATDHAKLDGYIGRTLQAFFHDQSGVDGKLKFWFCAHKQFPNYNDRMCFETKGFLDSYRKSENADRPLFYPGDGEPSGGANVYFKADPLTADNPSIPFRIIHTRDIKNEMASDAALAFIDQEDYLGEHFRWENDEGSGDPFEYKKWDGHLLGVDAKISNPRSPETAIEAAREKWFIPTNDKDEQYDPEKHGMITVISESAVRTINWYLNKIGIMREFKVHRIEEIREQYRGPGWQVKPSLKSYRLEWPTIRNLEEAAAVTKNTLTGCIENLVEKHLGNEVASHLHNQFEEGLAGLRGDEHHDSEDVWDHFNSRYNSYRRAVEPLGNKVPSTIEPTTPESLMNRTKNWMKTISYYQKETAMHMGYLAEAKEANPELFPSGGHTNTKSDQSTSIDRISKAPETALEDAQSIQYAMASPIPLPNIKPAIYDRIHGQLGPDGVSVKTDFTSFRFVGYEITLTGQLDTYEKLADKVNEYAEGHFPASFRDKANEYAEGHLPADLHALGGFFVWPQMIKWANKDAKLVKNAKIICPDPRTFGPYLRKSLGAK